MPNPTNDDTRKLHRQRVLKGATILNGVSKSEITCTIRNMHEQGAELRVPLEATVPKSFLLYVPVDGIGYLCELRWRHGTRVGVHFTGTAPKPHWHYG